jgi:hypothetical protein
MTILYALASLCLLSAPLLAERGPQPTAQGQPAVNPTGAAVLGFKEKLTEYVKLHREAEGTVPPLDETSDPAKIASRETALGAAIRAKRGAAQPGDLFTPAFSPYWSS